MAKAKTKTFVLTFPLAVSSQQEDMIDKEFFKCWRIYNEIVSMSKKLFKQMSKMRQYRKLQEKIVLLYKKGEQSSSECKEISKKLAAVRKQHNFTEYDIQHLALKYKYHYEVNIHIVQVIASTVWGKWDDYIFGKGKCVHFKRFNDFATISGKSNATGIVFSFKKGIPSILYRKERIPVVVRKGDNPTSAYQKAALQHRVKFCRIKRCWVRSKWKYYVQLVLEGEPPIKPNRWIGAGKVGIDIGTQTIAYVGDSACELKVLASSARASTISMAAEVRRIQRAMDRSRRATNSDLYNADGTIKRLNRKNGHKQLRRWQYSIRYHKLLAQHRNLNRKLAAARKMLHNIMANEILACGNHIYVEDMNYKALQKRSKETKVSEKTGRIHTKKRFGSSLNRCAPAELISILEKKAMRTGGSVTKVNTLQTKASQFDHTDESYTKKKLSQRIAKLSNGDEVQRDLYSAFLLQHINETGDGYDLDTCNKDYPAFYKMYTATKEHLKASQDGTPSSIGI